MTERINGYDIHPMASAYPLLLEDELRSLVDDIARQGQLEPVVVDGRTGLVVDGRNRLAACGLVGRIPQVVEQDFADDNEVLSFILSKNGKRRHMTKVVRCVVVSRLLEKDPAIEEVCDRIRRETPRGAVEERAVELRRARKKRLKGNSTAHYGAEGAYVYLVAAVVGCSASVVRGALFIRKDEALADLVVSGALSENAARARLGRGSKNHSVDDLKRLLKEAEQRLAEAVADPVEVQKAREEATRLRVQKKELIERLREYEAREILHESVASVEVPRVPLGDRPVEGRREATAVCVLSDAHVEERVDLEETNGRNEYNPDICRARFAKLGQGLLWHLDLFRSQYDIPSLVLPILGDMISGQIHDELVETNYLSQVPAIRLARDLIVQLIYRVLEETDIAQVICPCVVGNHSRVTQKQHVKKVAENSFELVLYTELDDVFRDEGRVRFVIAPGEMIYLEVYDFVLRFVHGNQVRYNGGIGGVTIPLNKKILGWDTERRADVTVMGHHHSWMALPHAVINGSVVGYNEFAKHIGARYEPPQQAFFLVDSKRGYRHATRLFVDSKEMER